VKREKRCLRGKGTEEKGKWGFCVWFGGGSSLYLAEIKKVSLGGRAVGNLTKVAWEGREKGGLGCLHHQKSGPFDFVDVGGPRTNECPERKGCRDDGGIREKSISKSSGAKEKNQMS